MKASSEKKKLESSQANGGGEIIVSLGCSDYVINESSTHEIMKKETFMLVSLSYFRT